MTPVLRLILAFVVTGFSCSATQKRPVVATALDNSETRRESLEATLRVLDTHPEYVDEMFELTLHHPATLDRFLQDTAEHLDQQDLARRTATQLARAPAGLRTTLVATMDQIKDKPASLNAVSEAIEQRSEVTVLALVQRDLAVRRTIRALVQEARRNANAEHAFLVALRENADELAAVLAANPDELAVLFKSIGKVGVKRGGDELTALLRAMAK